MNTSSSAYCKCSSSCHVLPGDKRLAAYVGNQQQVLNWLQGHWWSFGTIKRGSINAITVIGEFLLHAACAGGQASLVEELLRYNDIHLNMKTTCGFTPIMLAAKNGHLDCVQLLLSSNMQCKLDLLVCNTVGDTSLSLAAKYSHWDIVSIILDSLPYDEYHLPEATLQIFAKSKQWEIFQTFCTKCSIIKQENWLRIVDEIVKLKDWEGVLIVLKCRNHMFLETETLIKLITNKEWDGLTSLTSSYSVNDQVYDGVLRKLVTSKCWEGVQKLLDNHNYDARVLLYNLSETSRTRQWTGVEILLDRVSKNAKLDIDLMESIIKDSEYDINKLLRSRMYSYDVLNAALLVSACYGVSEKAINLLLEHFPDYDYEILNSTLLICVMKHRLTVLAPLLNHHLNTFTFDDLCKALDLAKRLCHKDVVRVLTTATEEHAKTICSGQSVYSEGRGISQGSALPIPAHVHCRQYGPLQLSVRKASRAAPLETDVYDVNSKPRGVVLILNYQKFQGRTDLQREGSQFDVINLMNLFGQMGYETQVHWDLTEDQTISNLSVFRYQERLRRISCIIIFIMSHGVARQTFHTSDMQCVTVEKLQSMFLDNECPHLRGKPKLFFYNFCRGSDEPQQSIQSDGVREVPRDMLCIYSAPEGFRSYRHAERGTPFLLSLCQVLATHAHDHSLDDLLRKFKLAYSSANYGTTPDIQDLNFAKKFYFNPM